MTLAELSYVIGTLFMFFCAGAFALIIGAFIWGFLGGLWHEVKPHLPKVRPKGYKPLWRALLHRWGWVYSPSLGIMGYQYGGWKKRPNPWHSLTKAIEDAAEAMKKMDATLKLEIPGFKENMRKFQAEQKVELSVIKKPTFFDDFDPMHNAVAVRREKWLDDILMTDKPAPSFITDIGTIDHFPYCTVPYDECKEFNPELGYACIRNKGHVDSAHPDERRHGYGGVFWD